MFQVARLMFGRTREKNKLLMENRSMLQGRMENTASHEGTIQLIIANFLGSCARNIGFYCHLHGRLRKVEF